MQLGEIAVPAFDRGHQRGGIGRFQRQRRHDGIAAPGQLADRRLDLADLDAIAADLDLVVHPVDELDGVGGGKDHPVAGAIPGLGAAGQLDKGLGGLFGIVEIALRHLRPGHQQLAHAAGADGPVFLVHHKAGHARQRRADRRQVQMGVDLVIGQHIAQADDGRLGRAIPVFHPPARRPLPGPRQGQGQRLAHEERQAQLRQRAGHERALQAHLLAQRRHGKPAGHPVAQHIIGRAFQIAGTGHHQLPTGAPGDEQIMHRDIEGQVEILREPVLGAEIGHLIGRRQIGVQIGMGDRHALGQAGAARGEQDIGKGVVMPAPGRFGPLGEAGDQIDPLHRVQDRPGPGLGGGAADQKRGAREGHDGAVARIGKDRVQGHIGMAQHQGRENPGIAFDAAVGIDRRHAMAVVGFARRDRPGKRQRPRPKLAIAVVAPLDPDRQRLGAVLQPGGEIMPGPPGALIWNVQEL